MPLRGPGLGNGNEPGDRGQNCVPQGQVLIAASSYIPYLRQDCQIEYCDTNDQAGGTRFKFTFSKPATINSITILDLDEAEVTVFIKFQDGHQVRLRVLGDESLSVIDLSTETQDYAVKQPDQSFVIRCASSYAVSELKHSLCI